MTWAVHVAMLVSESGACMASLADKLPPQHLSKEASPYQKCYKKTKSPYHRRREIEKPNAITHQRLRNTLIPYRETGRPSTRRHNNERNRQRRNCPFGGAEVHSVEVPSSDSL